MRFHPLRFGVFLAAACFLSVTWIKSISDDDGATSTVLANLRSLNERLQMAEVLGGQVSKELNILLEELRNVSEATNATGSPTSNTTSSFFAETVRQLLGHVGSQMFPLQANIYHYMPHLRQHSDSLLPNVVLGKGRRGVSMVLGIPTVKRQKQSYLINTLNSLLYSLTSSQRRDLLIVVFIAETDSDYVDTVAENIKRNFPGDVQSGLLEVISPSQHYYPDFTNLKETFGDSKDRVKWRTKQNLDFSFLMLYAQDKGTYYVQLEDDVIARTGYYNDMKAFSTQEASKEWLYLEFSQLGFIGKMFRTRDLPMITGFFLMFHKDKPIDWLLDHILWVKVCHPEKDAKDCNQQKALLKHRYKPSLFQHVGLHSSLSGKLQHLKDKDFEKQSLYQAHNNPPAELSSSLKHYQQHSLDRAYNGLDFFWALTPVQNDYILFQFAQPIHVAGYLFRSGSIETGGDKFYNTTVEVLPSNVPERDRLLSGFKDSDGGFIVIGAFENGLAEGRIEEALQPISALRLVVHSNADVWALLSEIYIQV